MSGRDPSPPPSFSFAERANFAGILIAGVLYGAVVSLFLNCMRALLHPARRTWKDVKWELVAHTTAMFSFVTIFTVTNLEVLSISYVDNRDFSGNDSLSPGPFEYQFLIGSKPINVIPYIMFFLNNWLADGLLVYRCWIIYAKRHWVIVFPFLMYLTSSTMGILLVYQISRPGGGIWESSTFNFGYPYFLLSLSLNVLLTLMIIIRLVIHVRNVRDNVGSAARTTRFCRAIVTMLVESFALYTVNLSLVIGSWGAENYIAYTFFPILAETQVIAPFLLTLRVANRSAFTSEVIASSMSVGSISPRDQSSSVTGKETLSDSGTLANSTADTHGGTPCEIGVLVETIIEEFP